MKNHKINLVTFLLLSSYGLAQNHFCPSPESIRSGLSHGFIYTNANNNFRASEAELKIFKQQVKNFYRAEFFEDWLINPDQSVSAHCYYEAYGEVYLAKSLYNIKQSPLWIYRGGKWTCDALNPKLCGFIKTPE